MLACLPDSGQDQMGALKLNSMRVKVKKAYKEQISDQQSQRCVRRIRFRCEIRFHSRRVFDPKLCQHFGFVKKWFQMPILSTFGTYL
jgi:hypothetical protein